MAMSIFTISFFSLVFQISGFIFFFIQFVLLVYDYQLLLVYICFIGIGCLFCMMLLKFDDALYEYYDILYLLKSKWLWHNFWWIWNIYSSLEKCYDFIFDGGRDKGFNMIMYMDMYNWSCHVCEKVSNPPPHSTHGYLRTLHFHGKDEWYNLNYVFLFFFCKGLWSVLLLFQSS